jgi:hypothetical protein
MTRANELLLANSARAADTLRRPSLARRSAIRLHREIEALISESVESLGVVAYVAWVGRIVIT